MATGREFFDACCRFIGQPYSTAPGRTDPNSGHKDCSGMVAAGYEVVMGYELGAYVTVTIFDQSARQGLEIPYHAAVDVVGACFLRPENPYIGWGPAGHIAVSDGRGGTVEATPPRVQRLPLSYNAPWSSRACLLPGIDYTNLGEGGAPVASQPTRSDMDAIYAGHPDGSSTLIVAKSGGQILYDISGPQMQGYGGLPEHPHTSYALNGTGTPRDQIPIRMVPATQLDEARKVAYNAANAPTGGGGSTPIDYAALAKAVNDDAAARMKA